MFGSDNQAPVHPLVLEAIFEANEGRAGSYGNDIWSAKALVAVKETFETDDLAMYVVGTGGAANGLALSLLSPPWGAVLAHTSAHILADEGSGPELYTNGARMIGIGGDQPKLSATELAAAAQTFSRDNVHSPQPRVVTITNLSENGLVYRTEEVEELAQVCKAHDFALHMDGARFANALASSDASPADMTWRAGVDALSFGLTKNGAACAEALLVFGQARDTAAPYLRKRAGHLFSKQRYMSAQFVAMLDDGLWLNLATLANSMAKLLADALEKSGCTLAFLVEGNEVFVQLSVAQYQALASAGVDCYPWPAAGDGIYRFVTCWETSLADINQVKRVLGSL